MYNKNMVFVLSMHRSGTQSMNHFLSSIGYSAIHNPSGRSKLDFQDEWCGRENDLEYIFNSLLLHIEGKFNAVSDNPMAALYEQAYRRYPNAKFLLSIRNPDRWVTSIRGHIRERDLVPAEKAQYWKYLGNFRPQKISEITDGTLRNVYKKHYQETVSFFKKEGALNQLCIIDLDDSKEENGQKLSRFFAVSGCSLPHIDNKKKPATAFTI